MPITQAYQALSKMRFGFEYEILAAINKVHLSYLRLDNQKLQELLDNSLTPYVALTPPTLNLPLYKHDENTSLIYIFQEYPTEVNEDTGDPALLIYEEYIDKNGNETYNFEFKYTPKQNIQKMLKYKDVSNNKKNEIFNRIKSYSNEFFNDFYNDGYKANFLEDYYIQRQFLWTVTSDSSVKINNTNTIYKNKKEDFNVNPKYPFMFLGFEIVSNIINGYSVLQERLSQFQTALNKIESDFQHNLQFVNNETTSNHVHISLCKNDCKMRNYMKKPENVIKLLSAWFFYEPILIALVDPSRADNKYCKQYKQRMNCDIFNKCDTLECIRKTLAEHYNIKDRYFSLNLENIWENGQTEGKEKLGTIEIRIKHGSNDMDENCKWIKLLALFISAALTSECITPSKQCVKPSDFYEFINRAYEGSKMADEVSEVLNFWSNKKQGGKITLRFKKSTELVEILGRVRVIYLGLRNKRFIRYKYQYVSLVDARKLKKQQTK